MLISLAAALLQFKKHMVAIIPKRCVDGQVNIVPLLPGLENLGVWEILYDPRKVERILIAIWTIYPVVETNLRCRVSISRATREYMRRVDRSDLSVSGTPITLF